MSAIEIKVVVKLGKHFRMARFVPLSALGYATKAEWDAAGNDEQNNAVAEYWRMDGSLEIFWEEVDEPS